MTQRVKMKHAFSALSGRAVSGKFHDDDSVPRRTKRPAAPRRPCTSVTKRSASTFAKPRSCFKLYFQLTLLEGGDLGRNVSSVVPSGLCGIRKGTTRTVRPSPASRSNGVDNAASGEQDLTIMALVSTHRRAEKSKETATHHELAVL